ncbi:hypothetical protein P4114_31730 [Pseudomonas aeruginosa]|nr:hypothetical protein [Pseudomonas aeruginosa]
MHFVVSPAGTGGKIRFRVDGLLKTVEQFRSQELHELSPPSTNPCATWPSRFSSRSWTRMRG